MSYRLIDTHAHLDELPSLDRAIEKARNVGLVAIIAVGSDEHSNQKILQLSNLYPGFVFPALGLHPWSLADKGEDSEKNLRFIESHIKEAVALGEIGLDYHKKLIKQVGKDLQKETLRAILRLAQAHHKPVLIHSRYAWKDAFDLVKEAGIEKAVFHWYNGTSSVLAEIIAQSYYISATPAVEYSPEHRRAVKEIGYERLLLETDSPVTYGRGRGFEYQAEPADVLRSLTTTAELKNIEPAELAEITTANAIRLFKLKLAIPSNNVSLNIQW
jgi:TatD DNase family protein